MPHLPTIRRTIPAAADRPATAKPAGVSARQNRLKRNRRENRYTIGLLQTTRHGISGFTDSGKKDIAHGYGQRFRLDVQHPGSRKEVNAQTRINRHRSIGNPIELMAGKGMSSATSARKRQERSSGQAMRALSEMWWGPVIWQRTAHVNPATAAQIANRSARDMIHPMTVACEASDIPPCATRPSQHFHAGSRNEIQGHFHR